MAASESTLEISRSIHFPVEVGDNFESSQRPKTMDNSLGWPWQISVNSLPFPFRGIVRMLDSKGDYPVWVLIGAALTIAASTTLSLATWERTRTVYFAHRLDETSSQAAVKVISKPNTINKAVVGRQYRP